MPTLKIGINVYPERKYQAWIDGSSFASLADFKQKTIKHDEYNDAGPGIVHHKCFTC